MAVPREKTISAKVTPEELALLQKIRERQTSVDVESQKADAPVSSNQFKELSEAFIEAIERTKPKEKTTIANRKENTPWTPPAGEPVVKLRRKYFQHGLLIEKVNNKDKELLNQIKPGKYCEGWVIVTLRKDGGIDIDYPVKTNVQRLRLVNKFGIGSFTQLLERLIDEKKYPAKYRKPEDSDLYEADE